MESVWKILEPQLCPDYLNILKNQVKITASVGITERQILKKKLLEQICTNRPQSSQALNKVMIVVS